MSSYYSVESMQAHTTGQFKIWKPLVLILTIGLLAWVWIGTRDVPVFHDVEEYFAWGTNVVQTGPSHIYTGWPLKVSYPPLAVDVFGSIVAFMGGAISLEQFDTALKVLQFVLGIGIATLLYFIVSKQRGQKFGIIAAALYFLNPVVFFDNGYWSQFDAFHTLLILVSLWFIERPYLSFPIITLAVFTKPQALPFAFVIGIAALAQHNWREFLKGVATTCIPFLLIFTPFILAGTLGEFKNWMRFVVDLQPSVSNNAHNFWWLITGGNARSIPDVHVVVPWLEITLRQAGFILYFVALGVALWWLLRRTKKPTLTMWLELAAVSGFSFNMFITKVHENHQFAVLPIMAALAVLLPRWRWPFALTTVTVFFNLFLQDPYLVRAYSDFYSMVISRETLTLVNASLAIVAYGWTFWAFFKTLPNKASK